MQEQKITNAISLVIQATYDEVQLGLARNGVIVERATIVKHEASSLLLLTLDELLQKQCWRLEDLTYLAANQGPAPYTTLRVVIATINGLQFALHEPLVGVDGLHAFMRESAHKDKISVAILNAFNQDIFFAIGEPDQILETGYAPYQIFLQNLFSKYQNLPICFFGNAVELYAQHITDLFGKNAEIKPIFYVSLDTVAAIAHEKWQKNQTAEQLLPLYLKSTTYKISVQNS